MWVTWQHHITPCAMMDTPCIDLSTGATQDLDTTAFNRKSGETDNTAQPKNTTLPPGNLKAAWKWLTATCQQFPAIEECKGCRLHHICQVCYAAALHELKECGSVNYLCDMAHEELRLLSPSKK